MADNKLNKVHFGQGLSTVLRDKPLSPGSFYYTTDTRQLYFDTTRERVRIESTLDFEKKENENEQSTIQQIEDKDSTGSYLYPDSRYGSYVRYSDLFATEY